MFSALILLCNIETNIATCQTISANNVFETKLHCYKELDRHEKSQGKLWAKENLYVISSMCVDWRWRSDKQFLKRIGYKNDDPKWISLKTSKYWKLEPLVEE